jgi:U3 small nucleolar RNA-associated protein 14
LPGWGQWTHIQQKKGQPAWILKEQESLKNKRDAALSRRKDAKLQFVMISEKMDKKVRAFYITTNKNQILMLLVF